MHLEFLLEEPSAKAALEILVPRIVGRSATYRFHAFQGKQDLLRNLPSRLRGYRRWLPSDWYLVVLLDRDRDNCQELKSYLEQIASEAGFQTVTSAGKNETFRVINRIAVEELESWFFGDVRALASAFPRVPDELGRKTKYRNPDAIRGGTWETLEKVLQKAGYYRTGLPKIEAARRIAQHMDPDRNSSTSFNTFVRGLRALITLRTP